MPPTPSMITGRGIETRFRRAMAEAGLRTDAKIIADGDLHRVEWNDDGDAAGWYVLYPDEPAAGVFGCWRRGIRETWCAEAPNDLDADARRRWQKKVERQRRKRARQRRQKRDRARRKAHRMLEEAEPADPRHPYLRDKGVEPHGPVRQFRDTLLVPLYGPDANLRGLQRIRPDGQKRFLPGTEVSGSYLPLGDPDERVVVAEGYSTAATIHEATDEAVAVAFNAGNLRNVAEGLREKLGPQVEIVLAADNDRSTDGNPGVTAATEAARAVDGLLAVPRFADDEDGTDFNDLAALYGPGAVRFALASVKAPQSEAMEALQVSAEAQRARRNGQGPVSLDSLDAEWGDPIPLGPGAPDSYPVDALPEWVAQHVVSVATATQTPTDLPLMVSLSALSVAVANKLRVTVKAGFDVAAHLWTATVLPPASRKSPVFRHMTHPIFEYEQDLADRGAPERQRVADERDVIQKALKDAKKHAAKAAGSEEAGEARERMHELRERLEGLDVPSEPRLVASDVTSEKLARLMAENGGRIAVLAPEGDLFRIMAGRYSGGVNFDHYKRAWTGDEPIRDDRMGREGSHVPRPALTMGVCLQPSVLRTLEAKEEFRGEGLLGRFIYAVPDSGIGHRRTGSDVPDLDMRAARRYRDHLHRLLDAPPRDVDEGGVYEPHELTLSPDARDVWDSFAAEVEAMLRPGGRMEHVPDWGGKLVGHVFRMAAALHAAHRVGEGMEPWGSELSGRAMRAAVRLGRVAIPHALRVFDVLEVDPEVPLARYLLRRVRSLLTDRAALTQSDLLQLVKQKRGLETAEKLDRILGVLCDHNLVRVIPQPSSGPGRPRSPEIKLHPEVATDVQHIQETPASGGGGGDNVDFLDASRGDEPESEDADEGEWEAV